MQHHPFSLDFSFSGNTEVELGETLCVRRFDFRFVLCGCGEFEFVFDLIDFTDLAVLLTLMVGEGGRADASSETTESFLDVDEDVAGGGGISVILSFIYHLL